MTMDILFSLIRTIIIIGILGVVVFRIFRIIRPFETGLV